MNTLDIFSDNISETEDTYVNEKLPWIEKYRPKKLDELISHNHIVGALRKFIHTKYMPHMLFYGPPGTGKTSIILAYAKELYGSNFNFMVMELNASDDRGIEVVRNKVKQFVLTNNTFCNMIKPTKQLFKLVILDETDAMTDDAQAILRHVMEKYTKNARFCLICNYIKKINVALQSRCISFRFAPLKKNFILEKMNYIIDLENINISEDGKNAIIKYSKGDMRKILNMLQSSHIIYETINENNINDCFGYPNAVVIDDIIKHLLTKNINKCCDLIKNIIKKYGVSLSDIINEVYNKISDYIINPPTTHVLNKLTPHNLLNIVNMLRLIEVNQSSSTNENVQIGGFVSIFKLNYN